VVALLGRLEELSRDRPDRLLRLRGTLLPQGEPFELLIFRGFSSSVSHPTAFDPDQPALPSGALVEQAELLQGPLNPAEEKPLGVPKPPETFLDPAAWS
jgi:hypothetical protein